MSRLVSRTSAWFDRVLPATLSGWFRLGGMALLIFLPIAIVLVIVNPGADTKDGELANEQRRTLIQVVGGIFGIGALMFGALRTLHLERQIRESEKQRQSQAEQAEGKRLSDENLKAKELLQSRLHNALDLLGKGTPAEPQMESRVAALLMLGSLAPMLRDADLRMVRQSICRYIRLYGTEDEARKWTAARPRKWADIETTQQADKEENDPTLRADIECSNYVLREISCLPAVADRLDLHDAYLPGADLSHANLSHCHLAGAWLTRANLRSTNLDSADLTNAWLSGAELDEHTSFRAANLEGCRMKSLHAISVDFSGCRMANAKFGDGTRFDQCDFRNARLDGLVFSTSFASGCNWEGATGYLWEVNAEPEAAEASAAKPGEASGSTTHELLAIADAEEPAQRDSACANAASASNN